MSGQVHNGGDARVPATGATLLLATSAGPPVRLAKFAIPALRAGQSLTFQQRFTIPRSTRPGNYMLEAVFDPKPREITVTIPPDRFAKPR